MGYEMTRMTAHSRKNAAKVEGCVVEFPSDAAGAREGMANERGGRLD